MQWDTSHVLASWSPADLTALNASMCLGPGDLIINEVDYDNVGIETEEFVEIYNTTSRALDLTGVVAVLYNGFNLQVYRTVELQGLLEPDSYYVLVNEDYPGSGLPSVSLPSGTPYTLMNTSNSIQNGDPDGIALIATTQGVVLDALSYGGEMTCVEHDSIEGCFSLVEGTATSAKDSNTIQMSLIRYPNGVDTNNAASDWTVTAVLTPGAPNILIAPIE